MNKIQILQQLHDTANQLEKKGLYAEANVLTNVMTRVAQQAGQSNLNALYNNFQQTTQQPNQAPQQPQQSNKMLQLLNEARRIEDEQSRYRDKFMSLFTETKRKIDAGIPMQETNGVLNATVMMNQMIAYMQPLADKAKNLYAQLGYPPYYNETTQKMLNAMREYSNTINNKYISTKRTQPNQAQQPVQEPK